jgi:DNA sulfur modification protein DndD
MLIESLKIENFRQFYNEVEINFSTDSEQNVTVVHGANGSGKTSLLNAFKWCFYGETDFDTLNEKILNEAAIQAQNRDGVLSIRISVNFRHEGKYYGAMRQQRFKCVGTLSAEAIEESVFNLDVIGEDGQTIRSLTPFVELKAILPEDLQPYFFFNGERIEHIAGVNQGSQVRDAIRKLMGLELVDRAIVHLTKARKQYRSIVREEVSEEQKELHDLIQQKEEDVERLIVSIATAKDAEVSAKNELKRISSELKKFEKSRELQEKRDALDDRLKDNLEAISLTRNRQKKLIDENGFLVTSNMMFENCRALVEKNRKKGVLPYGIKEQFIDDRIDIGVCICGTEILVNTAEHKCLLEVRRTAGTDDLESAYTGVSALIRNHEEVVEKFREDYKAEAKVLAELLSQSETMRIALDEISAQLKHVDDVKISQLEKSRERAEESSDRALMEKGTATGNLEEAKVEVSKNQELLERLDNQKKVQNVAKYRMDKAQGIVEIMGSLQEALANQVRRDLSARVDETFKSIIRKPVRAIIDDNYSLQVLKMSAEGEEYVASEQSTGERQVTSLSFIASIISLAKEKHGQKAMFFQGGLYPLVMDSPFGALDDEYREKVASKVSELSEQVIMFVSNSQWKGKVKDACEERVGKSYKLIYHIPNLAKEKVTEYQVRSDNGFEFSTLEESES